MSPRRRTAIVELSHSATTPLPLDRDRRYDAALRIDGASLPCQRFTSPLGDELWRESVETIRKCTEQRSRSLRRRAEEVADVGSRLFHALSTISPVLAQFLVDRAPRRLVIATGRAELHALPWETLTDDSLKSLALTDLSIVRCGHFFTTDPLKTPPLLRVVSTFGPETNRDVLAAVRSVGVSKVDGRPAGLEITDQLSAEIVNIVAHGDKSMGETWLATDTSVDPRQLANRFQGRAMVLMWSCFSSMIHSWGESPAMALHDAGNAFVLAFTAPLHFDASAAISQRFFQGVFGPAGSQDPESEVVTLRRSQFETEYEFCDWASMTLWLRAPLDLSDVPLGRLHVPAANWIETQSIEASPKLRDALDKEAALGDLTLVSHTTVGRQLTAELVRDWRGPVVHLAGRHDLNDGQLFDALAISSLSAHLGDRLLLLLSRLAEYRYALLLWTDATAHDVLAIRTLERIPSNVAIVLSSPSDLSAQPYGHSDESGQADDGSLAIPDGEAGFIRLVMRDRFAEAMAMRVTESDNGEVWSCRYLAAVKTGNEDEAETAIARLETLDPLEALLLKGNLESRHHQRMKARRLYQTVVERAQAEGKQRELARGRQELAWVAQEMGDRGLAEQMYRSAIEILQTRVSDNDRADSRWALSLGRALRDYGDLLATEGRDEAIPLLRRATAIHAMDGRATQVAYCFVSRSRLMLQLERFAEAEELSQQAAIIFSQHKNDDGWVIAVGLAASAACARNRYEEARTILERAVKQPRLQQKTELLGRLLLERAEVDLAAGNIDGAQQAAGQALGYFGPELRRARERARTITEFTRSLN